MHCMLRTPALAAGAAYCRIPAEPTGPGWARAARSGDPVPRSAIYHRRLTAQTPLRGHRVVAARLGKIP
ncbi:hypothetical protein EAE32_10530 [Kocuria tytonicola]|uniref:Uncharacterized protein n=2 Tax=Kocuria tytonicola TaxID=2055946 RepID=A0A3L9L0J9_9MICC|nr:hypothetical protein EAE32_10530 [Kocuria tytonicola]